MSVRWGILGPGRIAEAFAYGLAHIDRGELVALGGRDLKRVKAFGAKFGVGDARCHASHEALLADPELDAVYVSTPHPWHREHALAALERGLHVLCEKPAGMDAGEVESIVAAAERHARFFMEALMIRCHPLTARLLSLIDDGCIGTPLHVDACFGFDAPRDASSRLFASELGGGAILDVGCYPMSFARLVAGRRLGSDVEEPAVLQGWGIVGPTGVDEVARAQLVFPGGLTASLGCAITSELGSRVQVRGTRGSLSVERDCWIPGGADVAAGRRPPLRGRPDASIVVTPDAGACYSIDIPHRLPLYAHEANVASRAIAAKCRAAAWPAPTHQDSIGNARALDRWLACVMQQGSQ